MTWWPFRRRHKKPSPIAWAYPKPRTLRSGPEPLTQEDLEAAIRRLRRHG